MHIFYSISGQQIRTHIFKVFTGETSFLKVQKWIRHYTCSRDVDHNEKQHNSVNFHTKMTNCVPIKTT